MIARQIPEGDVFTILDFRFLDLPVITYMPVSTDMCLSLLLSCHRSPTVGYLDCLSDGLIVDTYKDIVNNHREEEVGMPMQLHLHAPAFILLIARCQYCAGRSTCQCRGRRWTRNPALNKKTTCTTIGMKLYIYNTI